MHIELQEYHRRLRCVREVMKEDELGALLIYSWKRGGTRYLAGYYPNYVANVALAVVPLHEDPTLFIRFPFDLDRAKRMCWFADVRASGNLEAIASDAADRICDRRLHRARIGLVDGDETMSELPYKIHDGLKNLLPQATLVDACQLLLSIRLIKSPSEFTMLRKAAEVTDRAVRAASEILAPGVNEYEVIASAEAAARAAGAAQSLVVISGDSSRDLVGPPRNRTLTPGTTAVVEAAVEVGGYWTQVARTFPVGEPTLEQRNVYAAVREAYAAAVEASHPGIALREVSQAATRVLEQSGYADYVEHDIGHGIGLDLPEPPSVDGDSQEFLQDGMAVVLHPAVRVSGTGGAFLGGTVLLTETGPAAIHHIPERLL